MSLRSYITKKMWTDKFYVENMDRDGVCKMFFNSAKGMLLANLNNIFLLTHGGQYIVRLTPQAAGFR
jgi:hypothetical protein